MSDPQRHNIVFCLFDALSTANSGLLEAASGLPALSTLRSQSALFTSLYAPCPESSPARASLFTGLDPCVHGLWTNGVELPAHEQTFTRLLAQAGYSNWLVGRRQLAGMSRWTTEFIRAGEFAEIHWAHGPLHRSRQNAYLIWLQEQAPEYYMRLFSTQANPDDTVLQNEQRVALGELPDELSFNYWVGQKVVSLMSSHTPSQPFLALAGFTVGSSAGAQAAEEDDGECLCPKALRQADTAIDSMMRHLEVMQLTENTVVFVASGRGNREVAVNHDGSVSDNQTMSENAIRVPLIMRHPRLQHQIEETPLSTLDIAPTVLGVAGMAIGPRVQGTCLLNALDQNDKTRRWAMTRLRRRASSGSGRNWQTALRMGSLKLLVKHGNPVDDTPSTFRLFNLDDDPHELNDLAGQPDHAAILEDMIDMMIDARCALEDRTEPRIAEF